MKGEVIDGIKYRLDEDNLTTLSQLDKDLLELIVNFRLPLVEGEVCFALLIF